MGLMDFTSDLELKGKTWKKVLHTLVGTSSSLKIFSNNYEVFIICAALGIMHDKRVVIDNYDKEDKSSVPRNVLSQSTRRNDVEFLLTTAIITSKTLDYTIDERLMIAFGEKDTSFKGLKFLEEFANYGVTLIEETITNHDLETMENLKDMLNNVIKNDFLENVEIEVNSLNRV